MPPEPREIRLHDTRFIGRRVHVYDSLPSTNDMAADFAINRANDGLAIVAEHQQSGRGQYGRVWTSRPGSSLLLSVLLFPPEAVRRPVILTALAAVAVAEAIRTLTGLQARIKWPNDLLLHGKKVCGILIEQGLGTVAGIGLNLNQTAEDFDQDRLPDATSLALETGKPFDLPMAANAILRCLDDEYDRLLGGEIVPLEADWKWRIGLLGRQVVAETHDGNTTAGRLREMSFEGVEIEHFEAGMTVLRPEFVRQLRPAALSAPDRC